MKKTKTIMIALLIVFLSMGTVTKAQTEAQHSHSTVGQSHNMSNDISKTEFELRMEKQQPMDQIMKAIGVKKGMIIGDVGAGRGRVSLEMAKAVGPTGKIYANDISKGDLDILVERCKKAGIQNVETILGKEDDPLLPIESLDLVMINWVIHEVKEPEKLLRKIKESLKPGASVVIIEGNEEERISNLKEMGFKGDNYPKERIVKVQLGEDAIKKLAKESGMSESSIPKEVKVVLNPTEEDVITWAKGSGFEVVKIDKFLTRDNIYILKAVQ